MIQLRPSRDSDLEFVLACESDAVAERFVTRWTLDLHRQALADPDCVHRIIVDESDGERVGFTLIFGARSPHKCIELRRIVCTRKGRGLGRASLQAVKRLAFRELDAHRLWLDVKSHNARARHLYASEGFVQEGMLRECLLTEQGFESMVLMGILRPEYEIRPEAAGPVAAAGSGASSIVPRAPDGGLRKSDA